MSRGLVFGSFVVDLTGRADHLPVIGETVIGKDFVMGPGGKGFNQCVAAHKSGAAVDMVTKLGKDKFADVARSTMADLNMDEKYVFISEESTGSALIMVDENTSKNKILVVPGASCDIREEDISVVANDIKNYSHLLLQLETNIDAVEKIIDVAYENKLTIILNPAPVQQVKNDIYKKLDYITPNEIEAEIITGIKVCDKDSARMAAEWFFDKGVKNVLITLGEKGVYVNDGVDENLIEAVKVEAIDTTGAGDAFNGGLLTGLLEGKSLTEAVKFATALAALSVQKKGTTPSMPYREEIDILFNKIYG